MKKNLQGWALFFLLIGSGIGAEEISRSPEQTCSIVPERHAISLCPMPIFNMLENPFEQRELQRDPKGHIMGIMTIALPYLHFTVKREVAPYLLEIETEVYPSKKPLYIDSRFVQFTDVFPTLPKQKISRFAILQKLRSLVGTRYFWAGTQPQGIPIMWTFYPHLQEMKIEDLDDTLCKGVDCSGLLFHATNGVTPRTTTELTEYGDEVPIGGLTGSEIAALAQPLDLFVWKGHVIIVLSDQEAIESLSPKGVIISPLSQRLDEAITQLNQENRPYFLRRPTPILEGSSQPYTASTSSISLQAESKPRG